MLAFGFQHGQSLSVESHCAGYGTNLNLHIRRQLAMIELLHLRDVIAEHLRTPSTLNDSISPAVQPVSIARY